VARTAVVVLVPEAEAAIGAYRRRHTEEGACGMGAHVTLLFPFVDTASLDETRSRAAAEVVAGFAVFDFSLASSGRFAANPSVLCLWPEPDAPFRALTAALVARFPEHPPYEGRYAEVVPHATVAIGDDPLLDGIARALAPSLPIAARAAEATLVEQDETTGEWRQRRRLPLRQPSR
jgi:2'-5' RNA ligase